MWLLLLMIMIMPYEASPFLYLGQNLLGIFPDFTVIKLLGLIGFGWAAMRMASGDPAARLLASRPAVLFLTFVLALALIGLIHGTGFQYSISRYIAFLVFMPFVLVAVRTETDLRRVLKALVLAEIVMFPYGLRQMFRFGERLGVGLYEQNYLATILVLVVPIAFVLAAQERELWRRGAWTAAGLTLILMVFLTSSRGGFVGLLAAAMVYVYRRKGLAGAVGVLLVLLAAVLLLPTDLGSRALATLFQDGDTPAGLDVSNRAHVALFWAALRMIADNPLIGVGPLNFRDLSTSYTGLDIANIAHNSFLEIAAESGLPVLAIFILLLVATFRTLGRATRLRSSPQARDVAAWAEGLRSGLTGFLVAGFFISAQYEKVLWLAVFLTISLGAIATRRALVDGAAAEAAEEPPAPELIAAPEPAP